MEKLLMALAIAGIMPTSPSLEEAIRRMTCLPAQKFQLKNIGMLKQGMNADIVVFNEQAVTYKSGFDNPHHFFCRV